MKQSKPDCKRWYKVGNQKLVCNIAGTGRAGDVEVRKQHKNLARNDSPEKLLSQAAYGTLGQWSFVPPFSSASPLIFWDSSTANVFSSAVRKFIWTIWQGQWILELKACPADTTSVIHAAHYLMLVQLQCCRDPSPSHFPQDWSLMLTDGCGEKGVMGETLRVTTLGQTCQRQVQFNIWGRHYLNTVSCFGCPDFKTAVKNYRGFRRQLGRTSAVQNLHCSQKPPKLITLERLEHGGLAPKGERHRRDNSLIELE